MRIVYDSTAFLQDNVGGVARYFIELANRIAVAGVDERCDVTVLAGLNGSRVTAADFCAGAYKGLRMPTFRGSWRMYKAVNDLLTQALLVGGGEGGAVLHETYYGAPRLWNAGVKRVITIHDMIWEDGAVPTNNEFVCRAKKLSASRADGIIFVSESTRQAFRAHYPQRCAEVVIYHGAELRTTRERKEPGYPWPFILFVGRREFYKNWSRLVDAIGVGQLWKTHALVNVGGPLTVSELASLKSAGIPEDRVVALRCDDDVLADLYTSAECLVFPSLVEGFGIPLLEAARSGCPIACSDIPVFREILPEGCWYFDPLSPPSIAASIAECLAGGRRAREVEVARRAADAYTWQRTADKTLQFYRELFH